MIKGSCHCGAVTYKYPGKPEWLTACNCSVCRRYAALWAYGDADEITMALPDGATVSYVWGDKTAEFHSCKVCGCTTHWQPVGGRKGRMAVNMRLAVNPDDVADVPVRHFDGANTWDYLD